MKKTKKALASLAIAGMVLSMAPASIFAADADRIEGADRYATSIKIAEKAYSSATTAIVAAGNPNNLVDSLAAAPLAAQENAPIYLTNIKDKEDIEADLLDSLEKLGVTKVIAVGAAAKDAATVAALEAAGVTVEKVAGDDRIATAEAINAKLTDVKGTIVVGLKGEADAMSVASFAAANKYQIVIADRNGETTATDVDYILGGETMVKDIDNAERIAGADRFATNKDVVEKLPFEYGTVYVANGLSLADALAASVLAAQTKSPILLSNGNTVKAAGVVNEKLTSDSKVVALGGTGAVSSSALNSVKYQAPATLAVESVSAINAIQVKVVFNMDVDEDDANDEAKYFIGGVNPVSAELQSDNRTVLLTFADASEVEVTNAAVIVEPVQSADDVNMDSVRYVALLTYEDEVNPSIDSIVAETNTSSADTITVKFSEPIFSLGAVKINGKSASATGFTAGDDEAVFEGLNLDSAKSHTIQFVNLTDMADNVSDLVSKTFSVTKDTVAPKVTLSVKGDHTIKLTFSKKMDSASVLAALQDADNIVKNESLGDVDYADAIALPNTDDKEYEITIEEDLFANKDSRTFTVLFKDSIRDSLGNKMAETTKTVTLTKDEVKPVLTGLSYKKNSDNQVTHIVLSVSEGLPATAVTPDDDNLTIVDEDGVLVATTSFLGGINAVTPAAGDTKIQFDVATPAKLSGKYTFTFARGFVSDRAYDPNTSDSKEFTIDFGAETGSNTFELSSTVEGVGNPINATTTENVIVINFEGEVYGGSVAGSATNKANYTLNGSALPAGTTITLNSAKQVATITLPDGSIEETDIEATFTIRNVKRTSGAVIKPVTTTIPIADNIRPVMDYAKLNSDQTLTVGFSEELNVDPVIADFVLTIDGEEVDLTNVTIADGVGADAGKYVLDLSGLVLYDGTSVTYIDMDGDGVYTEGTDILIKDQAATDNSASFDFNDTSVIDDVVIKTASTGITAADAEGNTAKTKTAIDVK